MSVCPSARLEAIKKKKKKKKHGAPQGARPTSASRCYETLRWCVLALCDITQGKFPGRVSTRLLIYGTRTFRKVEDVLSSVQSVAGNTAEVNIG